MNYFKDLGAEQRQSVLSKLGQDKTQYKDTAEELNQLSKDELEILEIIRARQMLPIDEVVGLADLSQDIYDGLQPRLKHKALGLSLIGSQLTGGSAWTPGQKDPFQTMMGVEQM
jgi:signal transduction histidine kinase